jgi:WD40 repeat protein
MDDNIVALWDVSGKSPAADSIVLRGHGPGTVWASVGENSRWVITAGKDGAVRLWDLKKPSQSILPIVWKVEGESVKQCILSKNDEWLLLVGRGNTAQLRSMKHFEKPQILLPLQNPITSAVFDMDGDSLITRCRDGATLLWGLRRSNFETTPMELPSSDKAIYAQEIEPIFRGMNPDVVSASDVGIAFTPDGQCAAIGSHDGSVRLWNLSSVGQPRILRFAQRRLGVSTVDDVRFSSRGRWLLARRPDAFGFWNTESLPKDPLATPKLVLEVPEELEGRSRTDSASSDLQISPDERWLAEIRESKQVELWNLSGQTIEQAGILLPTDETDLSALHFSSDSRWLLARGKRIFLWPLGSDKVPGERIALPTEDISTIAFSPSTRWLAAGSHSGSLSVFDMQHLQAPPVILLGHNSDVRSIAFDSAELRLVSADDQTVRIWSLRDRGSGSVLLPGLAGHIENSAITSDGRWLVIHEKDAVRVTALQDDDLLNISRAAAGREITPQEAKEYLSR